MADFTTKIQEAAVKNAELQRTLTETDHAEPDLKAQSRYIEDLQKEIWLADKDLEKLEKQRLKELDDHEKYRDSTVKRFLFKATGQGTKFAERASKEEREYFDILEKEHEAKKVNEGNKSQLAEAMRVKDELESLVILRQDAQRQLDSLYHDIFSGTTPSFPKEDELEKLSNDALQAYHDTRTRHEDSNIKVKLLVDAVKKLDEASKQMAEARSASTADMFGFGGSIADAMERSALGKAAVAVEQARSLADRASAGTLPNVRIHQGSIMGDVIFDNIFSDMAMHEEIKRAEQEVEKMKIAVRFKLGTMNEEKNDLETELRQREFTLDETRKDLQAERQKVFEQVAATPSYSASDQTSG
jgi:hypothetical protein